VIDRIGIFKRAAQSFPIAGKRAAVRAFLQPLPALVVSGFLSL
jgi:hypothetical protein